MLVWGMLVWSDLILQNAYDTTIKSTTDISFFSHFYFYTDWHSEKVMSSQKDYSKRTFPITN